LPNLPTHSINDSIKDDRLEKKLTELKIPTIRISTTPTLKYKLIRYASILVKNTKDISKIHNLSESIEVTKQLKQETIDTITVYLDAKVTLFVELRRQI
jgi:hypothetical protein